MSIAQMDVVVESLKSVLPVSIKLLTDRVSPKSINPQKVPKKQLPLSIAAKKNSEYFQSALLAKKNSEYRIITE